MVILAEYPEDHKIIQLLIIVTMPGKLKALAVETMRFYLEE